MAKINFDVVDENGNPTVTHAIDFDTMLPDEIADELSLDGNAGKSMLALTKKVAQVAQSQAMLNKLVATGAVLAERILKSGGGINELVDVLV